MLSGCCGKGWLLEYCTEEVCEDHLSLRLGIWDDRDTISGLVASHTGSLLGVGFRGIFLRDWHDLELNLGVFCRCNPATLVIV